MCKYYLPFLTEEFFPGNVWSALIHLKNNVGYSSEKLQYPNTCNQLLGEAVVHLPISADAPQVLLSVEVKVGPYIIYQYSLSNCFPVELQKGILTPLLFPRRGCLCYSSTISFIWSCSIQNRALIGSNYPIIPAVTMMYNEYLPRKEHI